MSDSTSDPGHVDEVRRRAFESTWTGGKPSPIEEFLPPEDDPLYLGTLEELVHLELEFAWKQAGDEGGRPRVEDYLQRFPRLDQPQIVARLREQEQEVRRRFAGGTATTFAPGMRLGRYHLMAEHARGGYGSVWRATDTRLGREVALKQLSGGFARHADLRRRFVNEARVTARLEHPGIVPVYDVANLEDDPTFYAMKLVRGKTLAEAIQQAHELPAGNSDRTVEQQRLLSAFLVVCQSMEYAHAAGVLHRDLKPQNIVLSDYGETVILDWGLAKGVDMEAPEAWGDEGAQLTRAGTVKGTPAYMSPEQAAGQVDEIDERSDVYALGVILYQVLTGRVPFEAPSSEELLAKVIRGDMQPPRALDRSIEPTLEAICLRAMATAPSQRYQGVAELTREPAEVPGRRTGEGLAGAGAGAPGPLGAAPPGTGHRPGGCRRRGSAGPGSGVAGAGGFQRASAGGQGPCGGQPHHRQGRRAPVLHDGEREPQAEDSRAGVPAQGAVGTRHELLPQAHRAAVR